MASTPGSQTSLSSQCPFLTPIHAATTVAAAKIHAATTNAAATTIAAAASRVVPAASLKVSHRSM